MECKVNNGMLTGFNGIVLIETLWNVKSLTPRHSKKHQVRINRNIMECKVGIITSDTFYYSVLIETLWNVKPHK